MLNLLKWFLKTAIFTFTVLIAAQLIRWNGKTLSDHVRAGLNPGQVSRHTAAIIRSTAQWTDAIIKDANLGAKTKAPNDQLKTTQAQAKHAKNELLKSQEQELAASEREKLKDLIKELNTPRK